MTVVFQWGQFLQRFCIGKTKGLSEGAYKGVRHKVCLLYFYGLSPWKIMDYSGFN